VDARAEEVVEQVVALPRRIRLSRGQHQRDVEARHPRRRGRHPRVIRLHSAGRHDGRRAEPPRVGDQKLQLPRLVAAERQTGEIVALEQNAGTARGSAERGAQSDSLGQRRRQHRQRNARK